MANPLVTPDRWTRNPVLLVANQQQPEYAQALVDAASDAVSLKCKRQFPLASYRLYLSGAGWPFSQVVLPNHPVASIDRICTRPENVLTVQNTDNVTNQFARVWTTEDPTGATAAVVLARTASAVTTAATLSAATYPTLASLAAAIVALGGGWTATVTGNFGLYPTADLRPLQGAISAMQPAALGMYFEATYGEAFDCGWGFRERMRLDADAGILYGHFPQGMSNLRIDYTAGYTVIPNDVQEAVVRVAQIAWQTMLRNTSLTSERMGPYAKTFSTVIPSAIDDPMVRGWLAPYVSHSNLIAVR
jgi:hypothetical protein